MSIILIQSIKYANFWLGVQFSLNNGNKLYKTGQNYELEVRYLGDFSWSLDSLPWWSSYFFLWIGDRGGPATRGAQYWTEGYPHHIWGKELKWVRYLIEGIKDINAKFSVSGPPKTNKSTHPATYRVQKRWHHNKLFFFFISAFWISCIGGAWWKTSTAQIWWQSVHGASRYGRMNTSLAPLKCRRKLTWFITVWSQANLHWF